MRISFRSIRDSMKSSAGEGNPAETLSRKKGTSMAFDFCNINQIIANDLLAGKHKFHNQCTKIVPITNL